MKTITVEAGKSYPIYIENNILSKAGDLIAAAPATKIAVISDSNVFPLYGETLTARLTAAGLTALTYVLEAGEAAKTTDTVMDIVRFFAENELTRSDIAVALGGGVTGDLTGFAAAIYLRGIDYVQIPTSLLAQVDASVGGKTAVNLPQGKNLCGAFHQPLMVLIDPTVLHTLPPRCFADGMAEAIKMGCIKSAALFQTLAHGEAADPIENIIFECVRLKAEVVARDEKEHGERALLNFGHTIGHAIERLHGYAVSHGEAVAAGMVMMTRASEQNGLTEPGTADRIAAVLRQYGLPVEDTHSLKDIIAAMRADKKRTGDTINLILLNKIGEGVLYPLAYDALPAFFGVAS